MAELGKEILPILFSQIREFFTHNTLFCKNGIVNFVLTSVELI